MKLSKTPELHSFLTNQFLNSDPSKDEEIAATFVGVASENARELLIKQTKILLEDPDFPVDELGSEANRWFGDSEEARGWLKSILRVFEGAQSDAVVVKDSNGAILNENDSVTVIKDLKVKGGSSDLKRGTLIKKIRLINDPEAVECRVDGSTLVLKTCFLKKV
jgi:protein PhnA